LQVVEFERAFLYIEIHPVDLHAFILRRQHPRRDVGIVVEPCHHDLIACLPLARNGAADVQRQRGHVVAEDDLTGRGCIVEIRHGAMRLVQHRIRFNAGGKNALMIGIAFY